MNIAIWIAIALVCFVLPATALTNGGQRNPQRTKLADYAQRVGLSLPEHLVSPVVQRLRRRQRGIMTGGITGIVVSTIVYLIFFDHDNGAVAALVILLTTMGVTFGGTWAIAAHRPAEHTDQPVVARMRSVTLNDYLTRGERTGFWLTPVVIILGAIAAILLLAPLPNTESYVPILSIGLAGGALVTWGIAVFSVHKVLAAPARSNSELELAWDDAERADGLRQVANLAVAVASLSLLFWLIFIGQALVADQFYQTHQGLAATVTIWSLVVFGVLLVAVAIGPVLAWITKSRAGYEQRQLWPHGVAQ